MTSIRCLSPKPFKIVIGLLSAAMGQASTRQHNATLDAFPKAVHSLKLGTNVSGNHVSIMHFQNLTWIAQTSLVAFLKGEASMFQYVSMFDNVFDGLNKSWHVRSNTFLSNLSNLCHTCWCSQFWGSRLVASIAWGFAELDESHCKVRLKYKRNSTCQHF